MIYEWVNWHMIAASVYEWKCYRVASDLWESKDRGYLRAGAVGFIRYRDEFQAFESRYQLHTSCRLIRFWYALFGIFHFHHFVAFIPRTFSTEVNRLSAQNSWLWITSSSDWLVSAEKVSAIGWFCWPEIKLPSEWPSYACSVRYISPISAVDIMHWTLLRLRHISKWF